MRQGSGKYVVAAFMVLEHCVGLTVLCIGHFLPTEVRFGPSAPDSDTGKRRRLGCCSRCVRAMATQGYAVRQKRRLWRYEEQQAAHEARVSHHRPSVGKNFAEVVSRGFRGELPPPPTRGSARKKDA